MNKRERMERNQRMYERYVAGERMEDIGRDFNLSKVGVWRAFSRSGFKIASRGLNMKSEPTIRVQEMLRFAEDSNMNQSAKRFGCSRQNVFVLKRRWSKWLAENPKIVH